eukprot:TRINITY_DN54464_c0_g1_i1.p1 TRINITY_DN54464_c0_g1~~TRINITY_DN54464_c0_g1_i1.p1  ORF type:complete len:510 (+),score=65.77 TRINITY_DN54464_c0_g1_i1:95-1624(+)
MRKPRVSPATVAIASASAACAIWRRSSPSFPFASPFGGIDIGAAKVAPEPSIGGVSVTTSGHQLQRAHDFALRRSGVRRARANWQQLRRAELSDDGSAAIGSNPGVSMAQSIFNLVKGIVGVAAVSIPAGMAQGTGLAPACILVVLMGIYSGWTFSLIGKACADTGERTYKGLGEKLSGKRLALFMDIANLGKTFLTLLAYSLVIGDSFSSIFQSLGLPLWLAGRRQVLLGMTSFVLLPLCLMRDLSRLAYTSLLGIFGMLYLIGFMVLRCVDGSYAVGGQFFNAAMAATGPQPQIWTMGLNTIVLASALSEAFVAHYNAPRFYDQLRDRSTSRFNVVTGISFGIAILMFIGIMCAGFLTFGTASQGSILNNYSTMDPLAAAARLAIGASLVCTYPLQFTGLRDCVTGLFSTRSGSPGFNTVSIIALAVITMIGMIVSNVGFVNNLGGAVFGAMVIYVIPGLLSIFSASRAKRRGGTFARATILYGVLLAIFGGSLTVLQEFFPAMLGR